MQGQLRELTDGFDIRTSETQRHIITYGNRESLYAQLKKNFIVIQLCFTPFPLLDINLIPSCGIAISELLLVKSRTWINISLLEFSQMS